MEDFNNFFNNNNNLKNEVTDEELARLANENTFNILMGNVTVKELFDQDIDIPLLVDPSQKSLSNAVKAEVLDGMIEYYVEQEEYEKCTKLVELKNKL
jgi:adenine-specific DNA methylase